MYVCILIRKLHKYKPQQNTRYKLNKMATKFIYISAAAAIIAIFSSFILSVIAIRCHQCNSHLQEDCTDLRLITPRAPRDDQYLQECAGPDMFCRKTVTKIEVSGENRVIRSCGTLENESKRKKDYCYDADSEGYKQTICSCHEDGCNAAPPRLGSVMQTSMLAGASGLVVLVVKLLRTF